MLCVHVRTHFHSTLTF